MTDNTNLEDDDPTTIEVEAIENPYIVLGEQDGEGETYLSPEFMALGSLAKADLLQDWMSAIEEIYDEVIEIDFLLDSVRPTAKDTLQ